MHECYYCGENCPHNCSAISFQPRADPDPDLSLANCLRWELPEVLRHQDGACDPSACLWCRREQEGKP